MLHFRLEINQPSVLRNMEGFCIALKWAITYDSTCFPDMFWVARILVDGQENRTSTQSIGVYYCLDSGTAPIAK
jgi:hypothetical protein